MERLKGWIKKEFSQSGKTIDDEAVYALIEATGSSMHDLANDMEKILLYTHGKKHVTSLDVVKVSSGMRSISVFEIVNSIMNGNIKKALKFLYKAIEDGEPPVRILYFITREYRLLLRIRAFIDRGLAPHEAMKKAGVPYFKTQDFLKQLKVISIDDLYRIYKRLLAADLDLKGSTSRPVHVLEQLIMGLGYREI